MKIKLALFILLSGLMIISCKKEDKQPAAPTNTGGGGGGGGGGNSYPASSATQFSGIFTTGSYSGVYMSYTYNTNSANAYFTSTPQPYINSTTAVGVNSVFLNGDSLWYSASSHYYSSNSTSSTGISLASETWSVNGANGIGSFTISNNFTTPSATGYLSLPDSISLASGFTVNINNVSNSSSSSLLITDGASGFYVKTLQSGNNAITITPSNLSALATSTNGSIALILSNKKAFVIAGKDYQFNREFQYNKTLKLKP